MPPPSLQASNDTEQDSVAVVMVNWNGWRDTVQAHISLKASIFKNWRLIVVDNASTDGSVTELYRAMPDAEIIENAENSGFAGGCNIGMARALSMGFKYIFLLNGDATVEPEALGALVGASASLKDEAILGSAVKYAETGNYQFFGSRTRKDVGHPEWLNTADDQIALQRALIETDFVFGAALFVPATILRRTGLFDERFYLNFEETDFCYRARQLGSMCFVVPTSIVRHQSGAALGHIDGPMQTYFITRNEWLFAEKHATLLQRLRLFRRRFVWFTKDIAKAIRSRQPISLSKRAEGRAMIDYLTRQFGNCPPVIRKYAAAAKTAEVANSQTRQL